MLELTGFTIVLIVLAISLFFLLLPLLALIDLIRSDFQDSIEKLVWVIVILFFPIFGSIIYFMMGNKNKIK